MINWKYTDPTNKVVFRTLDDGRMESMLASVLPPDTVIEPADPLPNPRIAEIKALLEANDRKIIRALAEGDTTRITQHNTEQEALRQELRTLLP